MFLSRALIANEPRGNSSSGVLHHCKRVNICRYVHVDLRVMHMYMTLFAHTYARICIYIYTHIYNTHYNMILHYIHIRQFTRGYIVVHINQSVRQNIHL